jgi:hypothetical protein
MGEFGVGAYSTQTSNQLGVRNFNIISLFLREKENQNNKKRLISCIQERLEFRNKMTCQYQHQFHDGISILNHLSSTIPVIK